MRGAFSGAAASPGTEQGAGEGQGAGAGEGEGGAGAGAGDGAVRLSAEQVARLEAIGAAVPGEVYALERDKGGRHGAVMRYNLNKVKSRWKEPLRQARGGGALNLSKAKSR